MITRQLHQIAIWQFIDQELSKKSTILQSEVVEMAIQRGYGSRKTILKILESLESQDLLESIEIPSNSPGRPKKAYTRVESKFEKLIFNLGEFPIPIKDWIDDESKKEQIGKGQALKNILVYCYIEINSRIPEYTEQQVSNLPSHLQIKKTNDFGHL